MGRLSEVAGAKGKPKHAKEEKGCRPIHFRKGPADLEKRREKLRGKTALGEIKLSSPLCLGKE